MTLRSARTWLIMAATSSTGHASTSAGSQGTGQRELGGRAMKVAEEPLGQLAGPIKRSKAHLGGPLE